MHPPPTGEGDRLPARANIGGAMHIVRRGGKNNLTQRRKERKGRRSHTKTRRTQRGRALIACIAHHFKYFPRALRDFKFSTSLAKLKRRPKRSLFVSFVSLCETNFLSSSFSASLRLCAKIIKFPQPNSRSLACNTWDPSTTRCARGSPPPVGEDAIHLSPAANPCHRAPAH